VTTGAVRHTVGKVGEWKEKEWTANDAERTYHTGRSTRSTSLVTTMTHSVPNWERTAVVTRTKVTAKMATPQ